MIRYTKATLLLIPVLILAVSSLKIRAAEEDSIRMDAVWVPDNGDGTYTNPILFADYSDPDVVRVGEDFYLVASSFNCVPGIPVLHSKDLVNWSLIGHVFAEQPPDSVYDSPGHGVGVWAPSIRYHKGEFYIYYADPDYGIYLAKASDPAGPWEHKLARKAYGWIDPCPFWDENDSAYLVHAYAKSRIGFNSILTLRRMSKDGETISVSDTIVLFDGTDPAHPRQTIEGPKMYKRNGYYYVFAPFNGVANGSQAVLRADTVTGPYKDTTVLEKGSTDINGPHQGGWVELESGESWFVHFQERLPWGRIVHLQPVEWVNDWPFMGADYDGNGIGEPVPWYAKPDVGLSYPVMNPATSDKFDSTALGLQWQWHSNVDSSWWSLTDNPGILRLSAVTLPEDYINLWDVGSLILQKPPAERFSVTTKLNPGLKSGEYTGLLVMGKRYSFLSVMATDAGLLVSQRQCTNAENHGAETEVRNSAVGIQGGPLYLRMSFDDRGRCRFSYSLDGNNYIALGSTFASDEGKWIGAKVGLFCQRPYGSAGDPGYADYEWFNVDDFYNRLPAEVSNPQPGEGDSVFLGSGIELNWDADIVFTDSVFIYLDTVADELPRVSAQTSFSYKPTGLLPGQTYYWRVDAKNDRGVTKGPVWHFTVREPGTGLAPSVWSGYSLEQNIPNPLTSFTQIRFSLPRSTELELDLYDARGAMVRHIVGGRFSRGPHNLTFDREDLSSGIYFLHLKVEGQSLVRKLVVE